MFRVKVEEQGAVTLIGWGGHLTRGARTVKIVPKKTGIDDEFGQDL